VTQWQTLAKKITLWQHVFRGKAPPNGLSSLSLVVIMLSEIFHGEAKLTGDQLGMHENQDAAE